MSTRRPSNKDGVHTYALPTSELTTTHNGTQPPKRRIIIRERPQPDENWVEIIEIPTGKRSTPHV